MIISFSSVSPESKQTWGGPQSKEKINYQSATLQTQPGGTSARPRPSNSREMTILYYIDSAICKGIKVGNDLYVEAQLKSLESGETLEGRDRTKVKLTIYKVSET